MKQITCYILAAGFVLSTGCSKKAESQSTKSTAPISEKVQSPAPAPVEKETTEKVTEKVQETKKALEQKVTETTENVMDDLKLSLEEVKEETTNMDKNQLMDRASKYKEVILEKSTQLSGLTDQVKDLSMGEMLGEKGKNLKNQVLQYTDQLSGLKDRYGVYLDKLKEYGVDLSKYGL